MRSPDDERDRNAPVSETPDERRALMDELRAVNEQLVVSSMRARVLAEQADALRLDAETANRLKDEFLAVVSHELRTPLSAVLGWARLLLSGQLDPERATRAVETIERNAKGLARIIDDVLDISRILGRGVHVEQETVDLRSVIRLALDEVHPAAIARGVEVTITDPVASPGPVAGDATRLQQVVANLLANAVKFTPSGGRIEVRLTCHASDAVIEVADTGQGISPDFLPHVFDRFAQADGSSTRRHGGVGLGLAIVRALVERHGGTVLAESPGLGQGATFTVRLPTIVPIEPAKILPDTPGGRPRLDGVRVLLVEDDADGREALRLFLRAGGADAEAVGNARDALQAFDRERPDVIVSDIGMPDEDGYALLRQIRARETVGGGRTPVIAVTGYVRPEDRAHILAAGFQAHVRKPVDPDEIVAVVAAMLRGGA